jgi:hypothetical protein
MFALHPIADFNDCWINVCIVPTGDTADCLECNGQHIHGPKKAARTRLLSSTLLMVDHAAINAGFDLRRYVMKPIPAKPRSSITQVDGCGNCRDSCARRG